jgi:hypothetical protein
MAGWSRIYTSYISTRTMPSKRFIAGQHTAVLLPHLPGDVAYFGEMLFRGRSRSFVPVYASAPEIRQAQLFTSLKIAA